MTPLRLLSSRSAFSPPAAPRSVFAFSPGVRVPEPCPAQLLITGLYGKMFQGIGYPSSVALDEGYSYQEFMACIAKIEKFAMGMEASQQKIAHGKIDDFVKRAYKAAGEMARRVIYGACPADRKLRAWVSAEEPVIIEARADGTNPRTASKDAFALREFEAFAELTGFNPNLQSKWATDFPERESLKMASFLLFRAQRAVPRSKQHTVAKPMSIYQNYLALRRVFKAKDVELAPPHTVRQTLKGLLRRFVRRFGIERLRPAPPSPDFHH